MNSAADLRVVAWTNWRMLAAFVASGVFLPPVFIAGTYARRPSSVAQILMVSLLFLGASIEESSACRIIDPRPFPEPERRISPLRELETRRHAVAVEIDGPVARVKVEATFYNPNAMDLEGTYFFPLPTDVVVKGFSMRMNGKEMKGELLDAERARTIYEEIVRRKKDPGLLEFVGMQMIKVRVYPIPAGGEVKVHLEYSHLTGREGGSYHFHYPFASAMPADKETIGEVSIKLSLRSSVPIKNIVSPTHRITRNQPDDLTATVIYEGRQVSPDRDFSLYWSEAKEEIGVSLITHSPPGEDGYFMLLLSPKVEIAPEEIQRKDLVFLLDTSGSMAENRKMEQAKRALKYCLAKLRKGDRFNILTFSTSVRHYSPELREVNDEEIKRASGFIDSTDAAGGTAVDEALTSALAALSGATGVPMLLFLTDGLPTIGETDIDTILSGARKSNEGRARVFAFGVGDDVNTRLLDTLVADHQGVRSYVRPEEDIEVRVSELYDAVSSPVLSEISVTCGGVKVFDLYPKRLPDLFKGGQITLLGRFTGSGRQNVRVSGQVAGRIKEFSVDTEWGGTTKAEVLPSLWAMRKAGYLIDQIRLHGEKEELVREVTELGKRYGIVTPYTSFLVVEDEAVPGRLPLHPDVQEPLRRELEAAEAKARRDLHDGPESGQRAIALSKAAQALQSSSAASAPLSPFPGESDSGFQALVVDGLKKNSKGRTGGDTSSLHITEVKIRQIGGKTFFLRGDGWRDSELESGEWPEGTRVIFLSEDYFRLIATSSALAKILSIGENIALIWEGRVYQVVKE